MSQSEPAGHVAPDHRPQRRIVYAVVAVAVALLAIGSGIGFALLNREVPGTRLEYQLDEPSVAEQVVAPLRRRLNGPGLPPVRVSADDSGKVEVIVASRDFRAVEQIKDLIQSSGLMRFLILANGVDHEALIATAANAAVNGGPGTARDVRDASGEVIGRWVSVAQVPSPSGGVRLRVNVSQNILRDASNGKIIDVPAEVREANDETALAAWLNSQGIAATEVLVVVDSLLEVRGEDLSFAGLTFDEAGNPAIAMSFTDQGSGRLFALTNNNAPVGSRMRRLGLVLDDQLLSAPNVISPIRGEARITGQFTREEVDRMVWLLRAGVLPVAMPDAPVDESEIEVETELSDFF